MSLFFEHKIWFDLWPKLKVWCPPCVGTHILSGLLFVFALLLWPRYARQVRGETLSIKERDFVALARIANCSHVRIFWRHIFPSVLPTLLVLVTLQAGYIVLLESTLSFLGVGIPPSTPAWGLMISEGRHRHGLRLVGGAVAGARHPIDGPLRQSAWRF